MIININNSVKGFVAGWVHVMQGVPGQVSPCPIWSACDPSGRASLGASWEGLLLHQVLQQLSIRREERFFWATHGGAELDLLVLQQGHRVGFEFKRTELPRVTASMRVALETLRLDRLLLVHAGSRSFDLEPAVRAVAASSLVRELRQIAS